MAQANDKHVWLPARWSFDTVLFHQANDGAEDSSGGGSTRAGTPLAAAGDGELARACLDGDESAYGQIVERYTARIFTHLYRMLHHREEAEDATQETFLRAYRHLGRFDTARPFQSWLYAIATNIGLNALRSRRRRGFGVSIDRAWRPEAPFESTDQDGLERAAKSERKDKIAAAVGRLPARAAALIQMHYHEGMTLREAGAIIGISESAAKVTLFRARKQLRQWLTDLEQT